ncbi:MAG: sulfotransferase, partial [Xanthomonadales bacterium]|nr:sulfotransferase [Xanthomonadales bacterium]
MATRHSIQQATEAIRAGRFSEAAETLGAILKGQPGNEKARWLMIQSLEQLGRFDDVLEQLGQLFRQVSRDLAKITQTALFAQQRGYPLDGAIQAFARFLERNPTSAVAAFNHAYYLGRSGRHQESVVAYQRALDLGIKSPEEVHLNMANIFMEHLEEPEKARNHLEAALAEKPEYVQAHFNLGNLAERLGKRDEARRQFEKCLELDPQSDLALARLADTQRFESAEDPLLARMADRAASSENVDLHFALGRAYDQLAAYDDAWRHFERANELDRARYPEYRQSRSEALVRRIMSKCDADWLARFEGQSHDPVFICGIFRSGSTLLEQILGAHPQFTAGGESEFIPRLIARHLRGYPEGLEGLGQDSIADWRTAHAELSEARTGGTSRLTDKRPDNFLYVGLIKAILPGAKFVVTERDWRDVAVSMFSTRLGPRQRYATRLQDIRHYLDLHRELVDHWAAVLGEDLIRVSYEDLVSAPRDTIGAALERLGAPWDDACLEFNKQEASVGTASVWQVRQPLNTGSMGRWKNYRKYFEEAG